LLVPKNGTIADLVAVLARKLSLDSTTAQLIRVYEAHAGKVYKELSDEVPIVGINEYVTLYAEKVPEDELNATEDDRAIYCFHFDKEPTKPHGVPFKFVLKPGELFKETTERLSKRTGIKGKLLEKIKFAIVSRNLYAKPRYLEDGEPTLLPYTIVGMN
jgi:ubiquitin carboxyl-terminal hydrolase 7